jgi:hypothetical protein
MCQLCSGSPECECSCSGTVSTNITGEYITRCQWCPHVIEPMFILNPKLKHILEKGLNT